MWFWIILAVVIVAIGVWYTRPPPPPRLRPITPIRSVSQTISARKKKKAKKKVQGPPMLILWASQTGTAEEFAGTLQEEAELYGFDARSQDIEEYFNEGPVRDMRRALCALHAYCTRSARVVQEQLPRHFTSGML